MNIGQFQTAIPYPTVHKGGIRAVAIATPGNTVRVPVLSLTEAAITPANPPKNAIAISKT